MKASEAKALSDKANSNEAFFSELFAAIKQAATHGHNSVLVKIELNPMRITYLNELGYTVKEERQKHAYGVKNLEKPIYSNSLFGKKQIVDYEVDIIKNDQLEGYTISWDLKQ